MINRKTVRRIYRRMGGDEPRCMWVAKICLAPIKTDHSSKVWETDRYGWCGPVGGWCFFNVLDICIRQWLAYQFSTLITSDVAIESLVEAVAIAKPYCSKLTLQCDNGSQYAGKKFRKAASLLDIHLSFIHTHTPEQNGHIESFHGTLKREYVWPHDFSNYQETEAAISEVFRDTTMPSCTLL